MADEESKDEEGPSVIEGEPCPICQAKTLTLYESEKEVPYFGVCYLFSMDCTSCGYHKADVEAKEQKEPARFTLEISCEDDMKIRIVKSSNALVKLPHIGNIEPGEASNGYVTNVEGILNRMKTQIEHLRDSEEDPETQKKAKNMVKKLVRVIWGQEKQKLIIEDETGNSAIISDKAVKTKL